MLGKQRAQISFDSLLNSDVFFVSMPNLSFKGETDIRYQFSGRYTNSEGNDENFVSEVASISGLEGTMTFEEIPYPQLVTSSSENPLSYFEISGAVMSEAKLMTKGDSNRYQISFNDSNEVVNKAIISFYKKDGSIKFHSYVANVEVADPVTGINIQKPQYLSTSKKIILEYKVVEPINSVKINIYKNGNTIYDKTREQLAVNQTYIDTVDIVIASDDKISVIFYVTGTSGKETYKQFMINNSGTEEFSGTANTESAGKLTHSLISVSDGQYESAIVDINGLRGDLATLSKDGSGNYKSLELPLVEIGRTKIIGYQIKNGERVACAYTEKYIYPEVTISHEVSITSKVVTVNLAVKPEYSSLSYEPASIKFVQYTLGFDGETENINEDTIAYNPNNVLAPRSFALNQNNQVYYIKAFFSDELGQQEIAKTSNMALNDFVVINNVIDISKSFRTLEYKVDFSIFSSEEKNISVIVKNPQNVSISEHSYSARSGMRKDSLTISAAVDNDIVRRGNVSIVFENNSSPYLYNINYVDIYASSIYSSDTSVNVNVTINSNVSEINKLRYVVYKNNTKKEVIKEDDIAVGEITETDYGFEVEGPSPITELYIEVYVDYKDGRTDVLEGSCGVSV